jgi:hypothetical protein
MQMKKIKIRLLKLSFILFVLFLRQIDRTDAFFSTSATSDGNTITAGTVGFGSSTGSLHINKYFCPAGVSVGSAQKPDSSGNATIPTGCTAGTDIRFKGTDNISGGDNNPPADDEFNIFDETTDGNGELTIDNLASGAYGVAEFPASGDRLSDDFILGAFCSTSGGPFNNNYELAQISAGETTYCNVYNKMLFPGGGYTPPSPYSQGDVLINEIMWMGSSGSTADEWIELKNTTGDIIEVSGWTIENAGSGDNPITIPESSFIPVNGYFLISHYTSGDSAIKDSITVDLTLSGISLNNSGEKLILKDYYGTVIDQTPSGVWPAGTNNTGTTPPTRQSMERNDDPASGWHTCVDPDCNTSAFWDEPPENNYGTPKSANLSDNDPSSVKSNTIDETVEKNTAAKEGSGINGNNDSENNQENQEDKDIGKDNSLEIKEASESGALDDKSSSSISNQQDNKQENGIEQENSVINSAAGNMNMEEDKDIEKIDTQDIQDIKQDNSQQNLENSSQEKAHDNSKEELDIGNENQEL